ncbi:MAG TPA: DUF1214 domain-containing protein [Paraburkholderia sp.]|nr:DUF1214 domain-containing protein [Paraburkholderia sp.]
MRSALILAVVLAMGTGLAGCQHVPPQDASTTTSQSSAATGTRYATLAAIPFDGGYPKDGTAFDMLSRFIDHEYVDPQDMEMRGMLAALGIVKGHAFQPDGHTRALLDDAAKTAGKIGLAGSWSVTVYDSMTASGLDNGQPFPSINTMDRPIRNADGSTDIYFGLESPGAGKNWLGTLPGKGHFVILRLYGPTRAFFEKTWKPGDVEKLG